LTVIRFAGNESDDTSLVPPGEIMLGLYSLTLFVSALLLFSVQPMVGKMILPRFGGASSVWNTCMVFFQAQLLVGYLYSHLSSRWLRPRWQMRLHLLVLALPVLVLPITFSGDAPAASDSTNIWLLAELCAVVGLPFLVVASTAPLLQNWFSRTSHPSASDPYFLYAASNTGSLLALLSYPFLLEPSLTVDQQSSFWALGFCGLFVLVAGCGIAMRRNRREDTALQPTESPAERHADAPRWRTRLQWITLAFVPSSLMLGVTTFITTDIASAPLLWVIPLALYLLTYILTFSPRLAHWHSRVCSALPFFVLPLIPLLFLELQSFNWILAPVHLVSFFVITMFCHGELARRRPDAGYLTEFYLWMSVGGVLGGAFNALVAPQIFNSVLEYPLVLAAACFLWAWSTRRDSDCGWLNRVDLAWSLRIAAVAIATVLIVNTIDSGLDALNQMAVFCVPAILCFAMKERPMRFAMGYTIVLVTFSTWAGDQRGDELYAARGFFGVNRVVVESSDSTGDDGQSSGSYHKLVHGRTVHGVQHASSNQASVPLAYYRTEGPMGDVFRELGDRFQDVAVIGLGSGAAAAYAEPRQRFTFFEIDPIVSAIASDARYFTFLSACRGKHEVVIGDARMRLGEVPAAAYDLIILDAFSSDSIPTHLLTREALDLYLGKLRPGGVLLFHISNKYMDLEPLIGNMARSADLVCFHRHDIVDAASEDSQMHTSEYVVLARSTDDLGPLARDADWKPARRNPDLSVWTDDYSNVLGVLRLW
jgi:SAM-dependent methyltransferase